MIIRKRKKEGRRKKQERRKTEEGAGKEKKNRKKGRSEIILSGTSRNHRINEFSSSELVDSDHHNLTVFPN